MGDSRNESSHFDGVALGNPLDPFLKLRATLTVGRAAIQRFLDDVRVAVPDIGLISAGFDQHDFDAERVDFQAQRFTPALKRKFGSRIAAHRERPVQPADGRHHNDVSRALLPHYWENGFGEGDVAEEVSFELLPQFVELNVFGETRHSEAGVINQHIEATVIANKLLCKCGHGRELAYIQALDIELVAHSRGGCSLVETIAPPQIAHAGNDFETVIRQFDGGQQTDAAGGASDESNFVGHRAELVSEYSRSFTAAAEPRRSRGVGGSP